MQEIQHWECLVTEVHEGTVYTQAIDVTAGDVRPEDLIDLPIEAFGPFESKRLKPGRIFNLAFYEGENGSTASSIEVSYRRWTQEEIDAVEAKVDDLMSKLSFKD